MHTSAKLENTEKHFNDILTLIDGNQNIKRYLTYMSNNPLKVSSTQPDITKSLIDDNIKLSFFDDKIQDKNKCFLFFNFLTSDLSKDAIGDETYLFDIIVPNEFWILSGLGQFRAIRIAMELCQMLDQKDGITGVGEIKMKTPKCYKLNDAYQGMTLPMTVGSSNMKVPRQW